MPSQRKIVIASVLKPVDDARNYKKIGKSLAETDNYEIYIIGFPSKAKPVHPNIFFYSHKKFKRLGIYRLIIPWIILKKIIKVKPELIIVNTHELLTIILLHKILFGGRIIYDIQENYYKNIRYSEAFPPLLKIVMANYVRWKEYLFSKVLNGFILSDMCYEKELSFIKKPYQIIENKSLVQDHPPYPKRKKNDLTLVYSGTIAEEYGIFRAIYFLEKLRKYIPESRLVIIGYCPNLSTYKHLLKKIRSKSYIEIVGGDVLVPQNEIIKEISTADFCILPYLTDTYYSSRIPTKIFDCLCLRTPMIIGVNPAWRFLYDQYDAFILTDFETINPELLELFKQKKFYTKGDLNAMKWDTEKPKLRRFIEAILLN